MIFGLYYLRLTKGGLPFPKRLQEMLMEGGARPVLHVEWAQPPSFPLRLFPLGYGASPCERNAGGGPCPLCRPMKRGRLSLPDDLAKILLPGEELALAALFDHLELWRRADYDRAALDALPRGLPDLGTPLESSPP